MWKWKINWLIHISNSYSCYNIRHNHVNLLPRSVAHSEQHSMFYAVLCRWVCLHGQMTYREAIWSVCCLTLCSGSYFIMVIFGTFKYGTHAACMLRVYLHHAIALLHLPFLCLDRCHDSWIVVWMWLIILQCAIQRSMQRVNSKVYVVAFQFLKLEM
jgi:ribosomal protein S27E